MNFTGKDMGLFLDLGQDTGFCIRNDTTLIKVYQKKLRGKSHGSRYEDFYNEIMLIKGKYNQIPYIAYEDAYHQQGIPAEHFLGQVGVLKLFCYQSRMQLYKVNTKHIKDIAIGRNTSNKDVIVRVINERHSLELTVDEHNAADSVAIGDTFFHFLENNPDILKLSR